MFKVWGGKRSEKERKIKCFYSKSTTKVGIFLWSHINQVRVFGWDRYKLEKEEQKLT